MPDYIPFKSYDEQLAKIKDKNIVIQDDDAALTKIKIHSYYTLINGYKYLFLKPGESDTMRDKTSFDDFLKVYYLDVNINNFIFKYILYVERELRSKISYIISREFGVDHSNYLDRIKYSSEGGLRGSTLYALKNEIENCKETSVTYYYKNNKNNVPAWILVNDIPFYTTISWYKILPANLRDSINVDYLSDSNLFSKDKNVFFSKSMHFLREYRNLAAHGKRNFKEKISHPLEKEKAKKFFPKSLISNNEIDKNLGTKDLYAAFMLTLIYLHDDSLINSFIQEFTIILLPYIDPQTYAPTEKIDGKNIYEILNLPDNIFSRIITYLQK